MAHITVSTKMHGKALDIELSESEVHAVCVAINTTRAEWDEYLIDPDVKTDWPLTQTVIKRALTLKHLASRFQDLMYISVS